MKRKTTLMALFTGCIVFSPIANAFWFFHRPAPVARTHHTHYRHHLRHHHEYHPRPARPYRRVITEYRIYYVPVPVPAHRGQTHAGRRRIHALPPGKMASGPTRQPAPVQFAPAAPKPATGRPLTPVAPAAAGPAASPPIPAGTAATHVIDHPQAIISPARPGSPASQSNGMPAQPAAASSQAHAAPLGLAASQPGQADAWHKIRKFSPSYAPLAAAIAALAGIGFALSRKRKKKPGIANQATSGPPQPEAPVTAASAADTSMLPASTLRKGFNYAEVRRLNVDRVFLEPFLPIQDGIGRASAVQATNAGGGTVSAEHHSTANAPQEAGVNVIQHAYGEAIQGVVDEVYDTPAAKAGLDGFYEHIPAEFRDPAWMKVLYNHGQNYTFAMLAPGLAVNAGDTVHLVFGQQHPPVPNQVVAVVQVAPSASPEANAVGDAG